jgi:hypothetical protein
LLQHITPEVLPRDLYDLNASCQRQIQEGRLLTEAILQHFNTSRVKHYILLNPETSRLQGLFFAFLELI